MSDTFAQLERDPVGAARGLWVRRATMALLALVALLALLNRFGQRRRSRPRAPPRRR